MAPRPNLQTLVIDPDPNSAEAEEAVLGSILTEPSMLAEVQVVLSQPSMIYTLRNMWVYQAMLALQSRGEAIDNLTVANELQFSKESGKSKLDLIGGPAYLTYLMNNTPTHIHAVTYATCVRRLWRRRNLLAAATHIANTALDESLTETEIVSQTDAIYYEAVEASVPGETVSMRSVMDTVMDDVLYRMEHPDEVFDIATGYAALDTVLGGGFQRGDLVIVAARPGMGKTSLALGMALKQAELYKKKIGIFTLEMNPVQLGHRAAAIEAGINSKKFRSGKMDNYETNAFMQAVVNLSDLPIYFDGQQSATIKDVCAKARKIHREFGIEVLYIDYLQLMLHGDSKYATLEIGQITRALKLLAQELNVPIVLLSQLNRGVEQRPNKRPMLSDLRQSGSIEQDADTVLFIYRDEMYHENSTRPGQADVIVAKQRNGETVPVTLGYESITTKFFDGSIVKYNLNEAYHNGHNDT